MKRIMLVLATAVAMIAGTMASASAGVERYQFTDVVLDIQKLNNNTGYAHYYEFRHNPCSGEGGEWEVLAASGPSSGPETVTNISLDGNQVTYTSDYDNTTYVYTATIAAAGDGTISLVTANGGVTSVTGVGSITQTSYNHGEYVAESIDEYGPDAHSCIGKPIVSKSR